MNDILAEIRSRRAELERAVEEQRRRYEQQRAEEARQRAEERGLEEFIRACLAPQIAAPPMERERDPLFIQPRNRRERRMARAQARQRSRR